MKTAAKIFSGPVNRYTRAKDGRGSATAHLPAVTKARIHFWQPAKPVIATGRAATIFRRNPGDGQP